MRARQAMYLLSSFFGQCGPVRACAARGANPSDMLMPHDALCMVAKRQQGLPKRAASHAEGTDTVRQHACPAGPRPLHRACLPQERAVGA